MLIHGTGISFFARSILNVVFVNSIHNLNTRKKTDIFFLFVVVSASNINTKIKV